MVLLTLRGVHKSYGSGDASVPALRDVTLDVMRGSMLAIVGPSGCGKSTLLHLCGGMDRPTGGTITFDGEPMHALGHEELARLRRDRVGFVFQSFNLLPTLTTLENIALPLLLAGHGGREVEQRAAALAARVGVAHRLGHYPAQLSGGELQRTAIARAVVHAPPLVLADEPTGSLDSENGARVMDLLREVNRDLGVTVLLATHAAELAAAADRVVRLRDGRIVGVDDRAATAAVEPSAAL
jgi:putative ABC transport system ATP-binding protein